MTIFQTADADSKQREIYTLADAVLDGAITEEQACSSTQLICNDADARRFYLQFMSDSAMLREWSSAAQERGVLGYDERLTCPCSAVDRQAGRPPDSHGLTGSPWRPMTLLTGVPLGYAVATLLLGVGIMAAWWGSTERRAARGLCSNSH